MTESRYSTFLRPVLIGVSGVLATGFLVACGDEEAGNTEPTTTEPTATETTQPAETENEGTIEVPSPDIDVPSPDIDVPSPDVDLPEVTVTPAP